MPDDDFIPEIFKYAFAELSCHGILSGAAVLTGKLIGEDAIAITAVAGLTMILVRKHYRKKHAKAARKAKRVLKHTRTFASADSLPEGHE